METYLTYLKEFLPYIVSIITGLSSYFAARRQIKADIAKLEKQHELDLERERKMFEMEKERMELEHAHQLELKQKEYESQFGADLIKEFVRSSAGQALMRDAVNKRRR